MIVEGAEEDEDEIREGLGKDDVGEIREGPPLMLGPLHIPRDSFSSAPGFDERPSEGTVWFLPSSYASDPTSFRERSRYPPLPYSAVQQGELQSRILRYDLTAPLEI